LQKLAADKQNIFHFCLASAGDSAKARVKQELFLKKAVELCE
jgi:hypothetical protein